MPTLPSPAVIALIVAGTNILAYILCAVDKRAARQGGWRISEATFFMLALAGGWPLLLLAMRRFRHKTVKTSFKLRVYFAVLCDMAAVGYLLFLR